MVKTLLKHEAKAYLHTLVPMNIILLCVALFTRIVWLFESDAVIFDIVGGSSIFALVAAMIVSVVMTFAFAIVRFYKNLFTQEGYLTMCFPVSPAQHIIAKLVCALGFSLITVLALLLASAVAAAGDVFVEVIKAAWYLLGKYVEYFGANGVLWIVEFVIMLIVTLASQYLLFYTCIAIGQLAKKNRILAAFGAYFVYYFICQILGTVLIIIITTLSTAGIMQLIENFISKNSELCTHIAFILSIVIYAAVSALYFFITHRIMTRKLNLE